MAGVPILSPKRSVGEHERNLGNAGFDLTLLFSTLLYSTPRHLAWSLFFLSPGYYYYYVFPIVCQPLYSATRQKSFDFSNLERSALHQMVISHAPFSRTNRRILDMDCEASLQKRRSIR